MAVLDAEHLLAVIVVAPAFAPELSRLYCRHQQFDRAGAVLLLPYNSANLVEHAQAQWQKRVDAGRLLPQHAGTEQEAMRNDFRFFRGLAQNWQKIA